ncbi:MAG: alpha/beta hydrolase family protein, partial [Pseudomonadales bacterium]
TRQASKLATIDKSGKRWLQIPRNRADRRSEISKTIENFSSGGIFDTLPQDSKHLLIEYDDDQNGVTDFFKVNVATGTARKVARNTERTTITYIDDSGAPRLATRFDGGAAAVVYLARLAGSKEWREIGRTVAGMRSNSRIFDAFELAGDPDSNEFYVLSNHETDTAAIYIYDAEKRAFGELQFKHPKYDATGLYKIRSEGGKEVIVGFTYTGKAGEVYVVNEREKALRQEIAKHLPDDITYRIVSRSEDGTVLAIRAEGPKLPPTYYLLKDQKLRKLGSSLPFLTEDMLAEAKWVTYKARDGISIPAIVTIPNGKPPFPVIVHPHGGPVARDYWGFDLWAQMLAYHGYLVIQPQFRISDGFGRRHLELGYAKWGHEMQDDLDDALAYLVDRKLADPKRAAIFGWSYGGYASFVGSFRDPNPYHCAIAGAGVADIPYFRAWLSDFGTFTEKTYRRTVDGLNPLDHVDSVDVPILVIHGDIDERVPVKESRKFVEKLKQFNKHHRYIELEGANHFFGTIYYRHWMEMFPAMIDWLGNTCGLASK